MKFENFIRLILSKIKNIILKLFKKEAKPVKIKPQKSKILSIAKKITPKKQPAKPSVATNVSKPKVVKETIPEKPKYILPTVDLLTKVKPEKSEKPRLHPLPPRSRGSGGKRLFAGGVHTEPHQSGTDTRRCAGRRQNAAEIHLLLPQADSGTHRKSI